MGRKLRNERYEQELTEIHEGLCSLLNRTSRLTPDLGEIEGMVHCSIEIRRLIVELEHTQVLTHDDALGRSLSGLKSQFLDLEGRLKEQLNDCLGKL